MSISGKAAFRRWLKFNAVGAMGTAVQLGVLAVLLRLLAAHFVWASILAVEAAVLHNFFWHWRWTWVDRHRLRIRLTGRAAASALFRFNLSNGLISLSGTALCTAMLTGFAHIDPLLANALSLAPCCIVNYLVSDRLVFRNIHTGKAV